MYPPDWHHHALCKIHLDMHCPEWHESILANFEAEEIVAAVSAAGSEALYMFAKDCYGNSYYPTEIGHRHRCLQGRDFLAEILEAAQPHSLPIVAYYSVIWDNRAAEEHPDWCMRDEAGRPLMDTVTTDTGKWKYLCHNSGYAEYAESMIDEIARGYAVQGFHLDMFNMSFSGLSCYCDHCARMFRDEYQAELPRRATWDARWRQFLEFRYRSVERFAERLRSAVHQRLPGLCVVMNYHGSPDFDWRVGQQPVRHSLYSDLSTGETYTPMFGEMYPGMAARFARNLTPGKPFEMVAWRMNRITDFTVKPLQQLRWELATCLANGGSAMLIDQPFHDGRLDPVAYDRVAEAFADCRQVRTYLEGEFVKHVGIFYSGRSRDWFGREQQQRFLQPVMGAYKALIESHVNVDFIFDETVDLQTLQSFPIVVLPNVGAISDDEAELLRQYVDQGGQLIATGETSLCDAQGKALEDFQLADVYGVHFQQTLVCDHCYFRGLPDPFGRGIDPRYYVLCPGGLRLVTPAGAEPIGDLHEAFFKNSLPDQFFSHNIHPPYRRVSPALFVNRYGRGKCIYAPFPLAAAYADTYELPEHRNLWGNLVRWLHDDPLVTVAAPLNTEVIVRRTEERILIHLITYQPLRQATTLPSLDRPLRPSLRMEEPPLYRATLTMRTRYRQVSCARSSSLQATGDGVFALQSEEVHEVIVVEL